jgi:hypothetical protein
MLDGCAALAASSHSVRYNQQKFIHKCANTEAWVEGEQPELTVKTQAVRHF